MHYSNLMIRAFLLNLVLYFSLNLAYGQIVPISPGEYFGYNPGDQFTRYHKIVRYFEKLAASSDRIKIVEYGRTYEDRPLILLIISNAETINNIESYRIDNLKRAGLLEGIPELDTKAIVWLSYNVHGNEASATEASVITAHELVTGYDAKIKSWLENSIIIIDPCLNPDGRERYVNWFRQKQIKNGIPWYISADHQEPWPGGRMNHYLFDNLKVGKMLNLLNLHHSNNLNL